MPAKPKEKTLFERNVTEAFGHKSIVEIANLAKINYHTLRNYLKERTDTPTEELKKLSKASNTSIHWLLTGDGPKSIRRIEWRGLWDRLIQGFEAEDKASPEKGFDYEIRQVKEWKERKFYPDFKVIERASRISHTSLWWLLAGEGQQREESYFQNQPSFIEDLISEYKLRLSLPQSFISKPETEDSTDENDSFIRVELQNRLAEKVNELALQDGKDIEEEAADLIIEALLARGVLTDKVEGVQLIFFGEHVPPMIAVPLRGEIPAGRPLLIFEDETETVEIAEEYKAYGNRLFVVRVRGESMIDDGILDGDLIICIRAIEAHNGQKVIALVDGQESTVKKFYQRGKQIVLQPANPKYPDIVLSADRVEIQAIVVGIQRRTM